MSEVCGERTNKKLSPVRRIYVIRLLGRSIIFLLCIFAAVFLPEQFIVLSGWRFFASFSVLHLLWFLWVVDMLLQILPVRNYLPLGAQKQFAFRYRKGFDSSKEDIRAHSIKENKSAYGVMLLWIFFNLIPAVLHRNSLVSDWDNAPDFRGLLCLRPCVRTDMVSLPADAGKQVLHHLQDIQLGSYDDVYPSASGWRLLLHQSVPDVPYCLDSLGAEFKKTPGKILGAHKFLSEMQELYR